MHERDVRKRLAWLLSMAMGVLWSCQSQAAIDCKPEARLDAVALPQRLVVIAETTHGTVEAPAFLAGQLCNFVRAGVPVILAWEATRDRQDAVNDFLASSGSAADRERLTDAAMRDPSGRTSRAVLDLLDAVRRWRQAGARVAVSMVDTAEADVLQPLYPGQDKYAMWSQARRQALMAQVVVARLQQYPDHRVLLFTSHASRQVGTLGPGYESATLQLSRLVPVRVVGLAHAGGQAWSCRGPSLPEAVCKAHPTKADAGFSDADQTVNLGSITASPPASDHPDPIYVPPPAAPASRSP